MTITLIEAGLATMVQGIPFRGSRHLGLPLAGAADPVALALANWMVGNGAESAALETGYAPLALRAESDCLIAVQGAARNFAVNGESYASYQSVALRAGDMLIIEAQKSGCRSYVAIGGGVAVEPILGGTSTYAPARLGGSILAKGAALAIAPTAQAEPRILPERFRLFYGNDFLLRVTPAPERDWIEAADFFDQNWTISRRADRIGLELEGRAIRPLRPDQLDSSAVFPGTIQCPPSGQPFLLGPDAQTTGGYPRIAQVIRADRHLIGQLRPGAHVRFQSIKLAEARRLYRSKIALIGQLQPDFRPD